MKAEILSVGTELLMGQIVNTNAQYIAARLSELGVYVYHQSVVGDNEIRLKQAIKLALGRSDTVITTGGLGPTSDDITKETAAELLGKKLLIDEETMVKIKNFFIRLDRKMTENNIKQAYVPEDSRVLRNKNGTAPGCIIEESGKSIILLPGPPAEMKPMFEEHVIPYLLGKTPYKIVSAYIRVFGLGESSAEEKIIDLIRMQKNPTIAPYAKQGEVTFRVTARCKKEEDEETLLGPIVHEIKKRLGDNVYSLENKAMEQVLVEMLLARDISVSVAESCTGGLISSKITDIPGSSGVFKGSVVAYSNSVKKKVLGVDRGILTQYGAVSSQVAGEMAKGVMKLTSSVIGISVTGIAGPGGGTREKPVGLVYVALADNNGVTSKKLSLWGDRDRIRNISTLHALDLARRFVLAGCDHSILK